MLLAHFIANNRIGFSEYRVFPVHVQIALTYSGYSARFFPMNNESIIENIYRDLRIKRQSVQQTVELIRSGATIPFIARYRKERTGGLDETQIQSVSEKFEYYAELEKRKAYILKSIESAGQLTESLGKKILSCSDKTLLEDIYAPYKPRKKTRALIARERGLEPLARLIREQKPAFVSRDEILAMYVNPALGVNDSAEALQGAEDIIAEEIADDEYIRGWIRDTIKAKGLLVSRAKKDWRGRKSKYGDYYDFKEPVRTIPSHRFLAIRRGANESVLSWKIEMDDGPVIDFMERMTIKDPTHVFSDAYKIAVRDSYKRLLFPSLENEAFALRAESHEKDAILVFSKNLRNLLLSPPAGERPIMGIDPGYRTGCKLACIDKNGTLLAYETVYPLEGRESRTGSKKKLRDLLSTHNIEIIAIGNGTASKETSGFVDEALSEAGLDIRSVMVSESGASVYSASEVAKKEFPDLDVTVRGAVSIARRLQDPLAELVKIDPKAIGVGQYQHDVDQKALKGSLDLVVESCVNFVGVEVNTASYELLSYVSGIGKSLAGNIVGYRKEHGRFRSREELKKVPKMGDKAFELSAGFLRIRDGENPLDGSGIHPETYPIVERIASDSGVKASRLLGDVKLIGTVDIGKYVTEEFGALTLKDIIRELKKPGLDPRSEYEGVRFSTIINRLDDLSEGMVLPGVVTNVTNFGAFVDIGVHQDGLVHISKLSKNFVRDPYEIVRVGDTVSVRVLAVDDALKRISLERIE